MSKLRFKRKAVSPVITILLIIIIAIAAALIAYAWVIGYLGFTTQKASNAIRIDSVTFEHPYLKIYVQNVGQGTVQFKSTECVYIDGLLNPDCTLDPPGDLKEGNTVTLNVQPLQVFRNQRAKIKVITIDGTFAEFTTTITTTSPSTNIPPSAAFTFSINGDTVDFTDASSDSDGHIDTWAWTFGDTGTSTAQSPSHLYASAGTYTVTLTVTDNHGATDAFSDSVTVSLSNVRPTAEFTFTTTGLTAYFTDASSDSDGHIDTWAWTFGDTGTSTAQSPSHLYASAGTYTVRLTVTDDDGATGYIEHDVTVSLLQYQVTFAYTGLDATASGTVVTVNGVAKIYTDFPVILTVNSGDTVTYSYGSTVASSTSGKRFRLDTTTGPASPISGPTTVTFNYKTQYRLTMATNFGTTTPAVGDTWYDTGSQVTISATAPSVGAGERYVWNGWTGSGTGSYTGTNNPATNAVTMNAPITETASWTHQYLATKLVYTAGTSQSLTKNQVSSVITVQRQDAYGNPVTSGSITVSLSTTETSSGKFYSDSGGTTQITSVPINSGSSSASFYYKDTAAGTPTLTASSGSLTPATTQFTINNYKLVFTIGGGQSLATGERSSKITVQRQTSTGSAYTSGTITVNLATSATLTGTFEDSSGTNEITVTISNGQNFASFYYRDTAPGTPTLTASATGYTSAQTVFTITGKAIPDIASSFTPSNSIAPGSQVTDTAMLTSATFDASGTFTYFLYSGVYPSGTFVDSSIHTVTNGIVPNSKAFTISTADAYYFLTSYSGDSKNNAVPTKWPEAFIVWPKSQTILLHPNADTSDNHLGIYGANSHYQCVNQVVADNDTTYVYAQSWSYWTDDTYQISNPTHTGTVSYVTINAVGRTTGVGRLQLSLETHGQEYDGTNNPGYDFPLTPTWREYTAMWARNPSTGNAWTWSEIDDLLIGCSLYRQSGDARCTQVYVEIYWTP